MRATLIVEVTYDSSTTTVEYIRGQLDFAANHLANNGLLTGDGPAVIDDWQYRVEFDTLTPGSGQ